MTTAMEPREKTMRKPLRIHPELLPDSAKYGTFDGRDYVMIPVEDFGDWYEDALDGAVIEYVESLGEEGIPAETVMAEFGIGSMGMQ